MGICSDWKTQHCNNHFRNLPVWEEFWTRTPQSNRSWTAETFLNSLGDFRFSPWHLRCWNCLAWGQFSTDSPRTWRKLNRRSCGIWIYNCLAKSGGNWAGYRSASNHENKRKLHCHTPPQSRAIDRPWSSNSINPHTAKNKSSHEVEIKDNFPANSPPNRLGFYSWIIFIPNKSMYSSFMPVKCLYEMMNDDIEFVQLQILQ